MKARLPMGGRREIDLRGASFDTFLDHAFDHQDDKWHVDESQDSTLLQVDPALQLAHAERLFRDPSAVQRFSREQRVQGFWFLPGWFQPHFFAAQIWNHDLSPGARISCVSAMEVLYRELFSADPLEADAFMWFDSLEDSAPGQPGESAAGRFCGDCVPVRRALIGVLDNVLALPQDHCRRAALHGLNHWGTDQERALIIDGWLGRVTDQELDAPPRPGDHETLRSFALQCRAGKSV